MEAVGEGRATKKMRTLGKTTCRNQLSLSNRTPSFGSDAGSPVFAVKNRDWVKRKSVSCRIRLPD